MEISFFTRAICDLGVYEYQFTSPGIHYYWSDTVDVSNTIVLRGVVNVLPRQANSATLQITDGDFEALYNVTGDMTRKKKRCKSSLFGDAT